MTRDETVALFLQGQEAWNSWAEKMLAERETLLADGRWTAASDEWVATATADFSFRKFLVEDGGADFAHFIFPSTASWEGATFIAHPRFTEAKFRGAAFFDNAIFPERTWFEGAIFYERAVFYLVQFHGDCNFSGTCFSKATSFNAAAIVGAASFNNADFASTTDFSDTKFGDTASFQATVFSGPTIFDNSRFGSGANFDRTKFDRAISFSNASFTKGVSFEDAKFSDSTKFNGAHFGGSAYFREAIILGHASFAIARFEHTAVFEGVQFGTEKERRNANFTGIKAERAFVISRALFSNVPIFIQADLKQAPDLDEVGFPLPSFWQSRDIKLIPHYRALRRMAIQGADYEREQMAFKGEVRSKRWTEHKPWHVAFWFGVAYDALSDFGRSIARPMAIGAVSWLAFAAIYFRNAGVGPAEWGTACANDGAPKALKALTLSAANSLPLIGSSRGEVANQFYKECLGLAPIPAWSPMIQMTQTLWSTVLIFLFLLALRNQFKIK
jgi:uncharacterized protein YjbI with pentapeptide repeats